MHDTYGGTQTIDTKDFSETSLTPTRKNIWLELRIVATIIILCVLAGAVGAAYVTVRMPKLYTASVKMQIMDAPVTQTNRTVAITGLSTSNLLELVNDSAFKELALKQLFRLHRESSRTAAADDINIEAEAIEDTSMFEIRAEAKDPEFAKWLADAAAIALIDKSVKEIDTSSFGYITKRINKVLGPIDKDIADLRRQIMQTQDTPEIVDDVSRKAQESSLIDQVGDYQKARAEATTTIAVKNIDAKLTVLRNRLYGLQEPPQRKKLSVDQTVKAAKLLDRVQAKEILRNQVVDFYSKAFLDTIFASERNLKIVYSANFPRKPSSPSWERNMGIGFLSGFLIGIISLSLADPYYRFNIANKQEIEHSGGTRDSVDPES